MVLPSLPIGGREQALGVMTETLAAYARACLAAGADGIFYATNMATRELISAAECRRFQRPYDARILAAAETAPFRVGAQLYARHG